MRVDFKDFIRKIETFKAVLYFFTGPEEYPKYRAKDRLLVSPQLKGFTRAMLAAHEVKPQEIFERLTQPQLFGAGEVIILQGVERLSAATKKVILELFEQSEQGSATAPLICVADNDRVDAADPLEGFAMTNPQALHVFFPVLTQVEVASWAKGEAKRRKLNMANSAFDQMTQVYGSDLYLWANGLKSLDIYLGPRREVQEKDISLLLNASSVQEAVAWKSIEEAALTLMERQRPDGKTLHLILKAVNNFLEQSYGAEDSCVVKILQLLGERLYELACCKAGLSPSRRFPYVPYRETLRRAGQRWNWSEITQLYSLLIEGERHIKSGALESQVALLNCVSRLWEVSSQEAAAVGAP